MNFLFMIMKLIFFIKLCYFKFLFLLKKLVKISYLIVVNMKIYYICIFYKNVY